MKISEQWLREWVDPAVDTAALAEQLTMAGLEVDAVTPVAGSFSGVVVAELVEVEQHPDADKLRVCRVKAGGDELLQIVCGAPNVRVGLKAPLATVGARLPGDFKIRKSKLRGVESRGMLCAEKELELSDADEGLMELPADAPVGMALQDYLNLNDSIIEVDLTPNRADCLSISGIAREVALLNDAPLTVPAMEAVPATIADTFPVTIDAPEHCPRYVGRVIRDIDITRPSPLWLTEKLRRSGLRPIDPVVDVTNYVLLELGQPLHAFDLDNLDGGIVVRLAEAGESMELLDGRRIDLAPDNLLITDHKGPVALAGIMGGQGSAVADNTRHLFLESALFTPDLMAGKARALGMHTDASHRFERGVDFDLQVKAVERATELLFAIVGGRPGPVTEVTEEACLPQRHPVELRRERVPRMLGFELPDAEVERILAGLGLGLERNKQGWTCSVPSWRYDIALEADLLEELARVYGYNRLPSTRVKAELNMPAVPESRLSLRTLRRHMAARGYREAITYSFIDPDLQKAFDPEVTPVPLSNPISADMAVMRTSLLPGLVQALAHNTRRQQPRVRLFESGLRFIPGDAGLQQTPGFAFVATGRRQPESWSARDEKVDFFDIKGDLESLLSVARRDTPPRFEPLNHPALHPGQAARILLDGKPAGLIGALHPQLQAKLDLAAPVFLCELDQAVLQQSSLPEFVELSRYPGIRRDLAVIVERNVVTQALSDSIRDAGGQYLTELTLFDVYQGEGVDPKRKSVGFGLTFRAQSRTLSDEEVNESMTQVIGRLEQDYKAELRS